MDEFVCKTTLHFALAQKNPLKVSMVNKSAVCWTLGSCRQVMQIQLCNWKEEVALLGTSIHKGIKVFHFVISQWVRSSPWNDFFPFFEDTFCFITNTFSSQDPKKVNSFTRDWIVSSYPIWFMSGLGRKNLVITSTFYPHQYQKHPPPIFRPIEWIFSNAVEFY